MAFKKPVKDMAMSMADKLKDTASAKANANGQPRQAYGTKLGPDESHLKQSKYFQQTPGGPLNPAQKLGAPKKTDGLKDVAAGMSKRFIGG